MSTSKCLLKDSAPYILNKRSFFHILKLNLSLFCILWFKEHSITCSDLNSSQGRYAKWKKLTSKGYILSNSIYITPLKWQAMEMERIFSVVREQGWRWLSLINRPRGESFSVLLVLYLGYGPSYGNLYTRRNCKEQCAYTCDCMSKLIKNWTKSAVCGAVLYQHTFPGFDLVLQIKWWHVTIGKN